jgi:hypothetical protein
MGKEIPERGLIIKEKYLNLIYSGEKTWEMRSTKTNIRGRIALIQAGSLVISGEATLYDCGAPLVGMNDIRRSYSFHRVTAYALLSKWKYPWILHDIEQYEIPIPYRHPQGAVIWVKDLHNRLYR